MNSFWFIFDPTKRSDWSKPMFSFYQSIKHRKSVFYCYSPRYLYISRARAVKCPSCFVTVQFNTRLRLLYLRSITRKCYNVFLWNCQEIVSESYTLFRIQFARRLSQRQRRILACFNGVLTLMFCESISKIFNFSLTAETKKTTMQSDNAAVSGLIADPSNFMSDCKQMQVR